MTDLTRELTNCLHEAELLRESQLAKQFPFFYGTKHFITKHHLQAVELSPHPYSLFIRTIILIVTRHPRLGLLQHISLYFA